jgi:enoyl-CoA hydratase/carnithine racemase
VSDNILVELQDGVATVVLNRPLKRNAVSLAMWRDIEKAFADLKKNPDVRVVILTGAGGNFCAGADISEFAEVRADAESGRAYEAATEAATIAIRDLPQPTIAAVSGYGVGGGCGLALACDFRVGDPTSRMGIPAARLSIIYSPLDCSLLYRAVGLANAKRILFTGRFFPLAECISMGLIDSAHEADAMIGAREMAQEFKANAPLTLRGSKLVLEALNANVLKEKEHDIHAIIDTALGSADYREGARAFLEKRSPVFVGR